MNRRQLSFAVASVLSLCFVLLSLHTWSTLGRGFVDLRKTLPLPSPQRNVTKNLDANTHPTANVITQMTTPREPKLHLQHFPKKIWESWVAESQVHSIIRSVGARESMEDFLRSTMQNDP